MPETQKHTPGPWTADDGEVYGPDGEMVMQYSHEQRKGGMATPADLANAILAASAPELLEALKSVAVALGRYIPEEARGHSDGCFKYIAGGAMWGCNCPLCTARAAIAKAEGVTR